MQTHNDDASFGGAMGRIVNVVTKSGTSKFHGSVWEFLRNASTDARPTLLPQVFRSSSNRTSSEPPWAGPFLFPARAHKGKRSFSRFAWLCSQH